MGSILRYKNCFEEIKSIGYTLVIDNGHKNCNYTIAIPTFNRVVDLKVALQSVYRQEGSIDFNVMVVDNNPDRNDDTEIFLREKYMHMENFVYVKNAQNIGMAGNWNRLFQLVKTPYLIMLHDDDCLFPFFLVYINELLNKIPDVSIINSRKKMWNGVLLTYPVSNKVPTSYILHSIRTNLYTYEVHAPSGCLFKVNDIHEIGGFDEKTYPSIDYVTILKLLLANKKILTTTDSLMFYRHIDNTSSKESTIRKWIELEYYLKKELGERLNLNKIHRNFLLYYVVKNWTYVLKAQYGIVSSFKGITCGGLFFYCFYIVFQFIYRNFYISLFRRFRIR